MNLFSMVGLAIITAALALVLRQYNKELAMMVSLAGGLVLLFFALRQMIPVLATLEELIQRTGVNSVYLEIVFKSLGVCYLTQLASDTCKDAGESAIAGKVELVGKIAMVVISLPLFTNLVTIALDLITI